MKTKKLLNMRVPMRDGVSLSCNVIRPDDGRPYPAILLRTPYGKEKADGIYSNYEEMALAGYNMVFQDVRGTGQSEGFLEANGGSEPEDGYDSVEWIAAQPWCDGNVGMQGLSYFGYTQMAAASLQPPHLKALCPFQNSAIDPLSYSKSHHFMNYHLSWILDRARENLARWVEGKAEQERVLAEIRRCQENWDELSFRLPAAGHPAAAIPGIRRYTQAYLDLLGGLEEPQAFLAKACRPIPVENIRVPMLFLSGWFDLACSGTLDNWAHASGVSAEKKKLIIGPWLHGGELHTRIDGFDFGSGNTGAARGIQRLVRDWFDHWLKGIENGVERRPAVEFFTLGTNEWHTAEEWPPRGAQGTRWFLCGTGERTAGLLQENPPSSQEPQQYVYDPQNPYPSSYKDQKGHVLFADPAEQEGREDVLVYYSEPLPEDLEVTGEISFCLYASTDGPDTDFVCRLSDTAPDGSSFPLTEGAVRGRFRSARLEALPELLEPGKVYPFTLPMNSVSVVFRKGHRIRIDVTSSYYPAHDRNLNTAERLGFGTAIRPARQCVFHDADHPSCLFLPVLRRG